MSDKKVSERVVLNDRLDTITIDGIRFYIDDLMHHLAEPYPQRRWTRVEKIQTNSLGEKYVVYRSMMYEEPK